MVHLTEVRKELEKGQKNSLKFWNKTGEVIKATNVICTSTYHGNNTINLLFENGQVRKIKAVRIFEFNKQEVCL